MNTALAKDISYSKDKIRYDAACRNVLADKHILAWILKGTLTEYKNSTIEEIIKCIEPPEVGSVRVEDTNAPERVVGISDSDKDLFEGDILYDIRFSASTKDTLSNLIINIEEQNDFYPGYPILKRATYYCGRMISAQNGTIFSGQDYGKLRKVVSIWICPNPPKKQEYTILRYATKEEQVIGESKRPVSEYDLTSIILINLGNPMERKENDVLRLLSVLLSTNVEPKEKKGILEDSFKIPMSAKISEEVIKMGSVFDEAVMRGYNRGKFEAKSEMIIEMLRANQPIELITKFSKLTKEKIAEIGLQNGIKINQYSS
ncbi:MAG: hypothetical protein IKN43_00040 [Selenomonadaceae bacterium]|nr:hypothetical protein [Selenomonadaceae bacterium]